MVWNFGAGPAIIAPDVLGKVKEEFLDWHGSKMSIVELSHRSKEFESVLGKTEKDFRELLNIPNNYKVLFCQGGGTTQFAMVPMNLMGTQDAVVDYVVTGTWSQKAAEEAKKFSKNVNIINAKTSNGYTTIPPQSEWKLSEKAEYLYYCANETIDGVEFTWVPDVQVPLICDMSSNILTRKIDVSKFALIYAGAQKNIGPSGVTLVIIREDMIGKHFPWTPTMLTYEIMSANNSLYNTPPTFAIYVSGLTFEWMKSLGGVEYFDQLSDKKSQKIYEAIDSSSGFYYSPVEKQCRSRMNITFRIMNPKTGQKDEKLENKFVEEAEKLGMVQLKGHRSVGGIRASIYNAMSIEGVSDLADFMVNFLKKNNQN